MSLNLPLFSQYAIIFSIRFVSAAYVTKCLQNAGVTTDAARVSQVRESLCKPFLKGTLKSSVQGRIHSVFAQRLPNLRRLASVFESHLEGRG